MNCKHHFYKGIFWDDQLSTDVNEVFCLPFNYDVYVFVENLRISLNIKNME